MCGKPVWSGFRTLPHSDMICRAYFWPPASRFSRFWRPAGKQVFSVTVKNARRQPKNRKSLFFVKSKSHSFQFRPLMRTRERFRYCRPNRKFMEGNRLDSRDHVLHLMRPNGHAGEQTRSNGPALSLTHGPRYRERMRCNQSRHYRDWYLTRHRSAPSFQPSFCATSHNSRQRRLALNCRLAVAAEMKRAIYVDNDARMAERRQRRQLNDVALPMGAANKSHGAFRQ
jgi:hypothetical protein